MTNPVTNGKLIPIYLGMEKIEDPDKSINLKRMKEEFRGAHNRPTLKKWVFKFGERGLESCYRTDEHGKIRNEGDLSPKHVSSGDSAKEAPLKQDEHSLAQKSDARVNQAMKKTLLGKRPLDFTPSESSKEPRLS